MDILAPNRDAFDRYKGMMLGLAIADAMHTRQTSYLTQETPPSSSLALAESLMMRVEEYSPEESLAAYKEIHKKHDGPRGLDILDGDYQQNFLDKFDISSGNIFEVYPKRVDLERTGIFHRASVLVFADSLDPLIHEVWMFDPQTKVFEDIYSYFSVLRLLVLNGREFVLDVFDVDTSTRIRKIIREVLHGDNLKLRYIETLDREEQCAFGALLGASLGYSEMMLDPVVRYGSRCLDSIIFETI